MVLFHETLHETCVLILAPDGAAGGDQAELADHLDRACRSGRPVWVDCRLLEAVSATTAWLLWACQRRLQRRRLPLVLCRVLPRVEQALRRIFAGVDLCITADLDDRAPCAARPAGS